MRISRALLALTVVTFATAQTFNARLQRISTSGRHKFIAPDFQKGDQRGPCPALNAAANHGYLPRNGVASIDQFVTGVNKAYGLGLDICFFLSGYGAVVTGNGSHFSIGGATTLIESPLFTPQGLSGSHNKYEGDRSPTREDLYIDRNASVLIPKYFDQLYKRQPDTPNANYNLDVIFDHMGNRTDHCIATNPYYFAPFFGLIASSGAYVFMPQLMSNHSAERPEGQLNGDVLKTFFSVTGSSGDFKYTMGHEKIPDNWYRRSPDFEYTTPLFLKDVTAAAKKNPKILALGGNTGTVNSFTGLNLGNVTGGVYNAQTLAENNNFACFVFQMLQQFPDLIEGLLRLLLRAADRALLANLAVNASRGLNCPQLERINPTPLTQFPGYTRSQAEDRG